MNLYYHVHRNSKERLALRNIRNYSHEPVTIFLAVFFCFIAISLGFACSSDNKEMETGITSASAADKNIDQKPLKSAISKISASSMFHSDSRLSGIYISNEPINGNLKWKFSTGGGMLLSSPTVWNDTVFIGGEKFFAVDAKTGLEKWHFETGGMVFTSPAVTNTTVYFGHNNPFRAVKVDTGVERWSYTGEFGQYSSPNVYEGVVYVVNSGGYGGSNLIALDAETGDELWKTSIGGGGGSCPSVSNGNVYVGADKGVFAFDAKKGTEKWRFDPGMNMFTTSPAVSQDGSLLYIGNYDGVMYAIHTNTGGELWHYKTGGKIESTPALTGNLVLFGNHDFHFYALNALTGSPEWIIEEIEATISTSPAVYENKIIFGSNKLFQIDITSEAIVKLYGTGDWIHSSPAISKGVVYFGSDDGYLYALD